MYYQPRSLARALHLLKEKKGIPLGGGSDLFPRFQGSLASCPVLIDLSRIPDLRRITGREGLTLGAMVTHQELAQDRRIETRYPILAQAACSIGSPQIRARGTLGGNLANASPAADLAPALIALEAQVQVESRAGSRRFPVQDLFIGPGETCLEEDALITCVHLPPPQEGAFTFFHKVGRRKALSIAIINLALLFILSTRKELVKIRVVVGSAAPTPLRIQGVEEAGEGKILTPSRIQELAWQVSRELQPLDDIRSSAKYRRQVAQELVKKYLFIPLGGI